MLEEGRRVVVTGETEGGGTYNFDKVATATGADEAVFVTVPFLATEMAVDQFPLAGRVVCYRRHGLWCSLRSRGQGEE